MQTFERGEPSQNCRTRKSFKGGLQPPRGIRNLTTQEQKPQTGTEKYKGCGFRTTCDDTKNQRIEANEQAMIRKRQRNPGNKCRPFTDNKLNTSSHEQTEAPIRACTHGVPSGPFSMGCHPGFRFSQVGRFRSMGAAIPLNLAPDTGFQSEMRSSSPTLLSFIAWSTSNCSIVGVSWGRLSQRGCAFSVPQPGFFTLWKGRRFGFGDRDVRASSTTNRTSRTSDECVK
jgi:hypothetical protein